MPENMTYIDAHSHLADSRLDETRASLLQISRSHGITQHLQGGLGPEDWQLQLQLQKIHPEILPAFGLHPYWVAEHNAKECEMALDQLARSLGAGVFALGETGLDFRSSICGNDVEAKSRQIHVFEAQLELARVVAKPLVLHIVRAFAEAVRILDIWGVPERGGMVHSFNGVWEHAKAYLDLGLMISVGGPLARGKAWRLREAVKEIPITSLLLETDSPDQPGDRFQGMLNSPLGLFDVAQVVAEVKGLKAPEVLDITSQNCRKLLQL